MTLYVKFRAPDDGRKTRLKRVQHLTEINKFEKHCIFWLYSENILAIHGHMNVKSTAMEFILKRRESLAFFYLMTQDSIKIK